MIPTRLKVLFFLILTMWLFCSCHSTRQMQNSKLTAITLTKVSADTSSVIDSNYLRVITTSVTDKETKDTAVGISGNEIDFTAIDGEIGDTAIQSGNVTLHVYKDANGDTRIKCKADSLTIVIQKLQRERQTLNHTVDSLKTRSVYIGFGTVDSTASTTLEKVVMKETKGFWEGLKDVFRRLLSYLLAAIIGAILEEIFRRIIIKRYGRV